MFQELGNYEPDKPSCVHKLHDVTPWLAQCTCVKTAGAQEISSDVNHLVQHFSQQRTSSVIYWCLEKITVFYTFLHLWSFEGNLQQYCGAFVFNNIYTQADLAFLEIVQWLAWEGWCWKCNCNFCRNLAWHLVGLDLILGLKTSYRDI
jgi:hypothetical protein